MMKRIIKSVYFRFALLRKRVFLGRGVNIGKCSIFEGGNKIGFRTLFIGSIGYGSYVGSNSDIRGSVGRFTSIGNDVHVIYGTHPYSYPFVTTSPCFFSTACQNGFSFSDSNLFEENRGNNPYRGVVIGNDCWIGQSANMVEGITINDGAVVLAGAMVCKDVPPYAIVGGVPAKIIKYRYESNDVELLMRTKWWRKDIEWIKNNYRAFVEFEKFKSIIESTHEV